MFYHVKELQFNARVDRPDPAFASLLLEQFGGGNGELKAAMQYFVQSFAARMPYPHMYDLLMDIATEELSHLEIVGATITMLCNGINGELKDAVGKTYLSRMMNGSEEKDALIHHAMLNPQFLVLTGGGPDLTNRRRPVGGRRRPRPLRHLPMAPVGIQPGGWQRGARPVYVCRAGLPGAAARRQY